MNRKLTLFFKAIKRKLSNNFDTFVKDEPVQQKDAVDKTLYLLRRDFNLEEQNEVMFSLVDKLNKMREVDIKAKEMELAYMIKQTDLLKEKLVLNY
jgi:hypothetical protein